MDTASAVEWQVEGASSSAAESPRAKACPSLTPSIWQKLPVELLEIVFTKLPISALKKFSRLSKRWRAFICSEEFTHRCHSRQLTAVYFDQFGDNRNVPLLYTAIPSPKNRRWKKHFLQFIAEDESVDGLLAANQGLLCYRVRKKGSGVQSYHFDEIVLVVHNLLTGRWRRLVVPYTPETEKSMEAIRYMNNMLVGLCVDEETGSYKLVVAFLDSYVTRKAFVYNSPSTSWTISAAVFPGLEKHQEFADWDIPQSICCAGELYWLVEEVDWSFLHNVDRHFKTMIKYSMKLDSWSVATKQRRREEACDLHLVSFENQLALVNFDDVSEERIVFPEEFTSLVPGHVKFDAQAFKDVMNKAVDRDNDEDYFEGSGYKKYSGYKPRKAAVEGSAMLIYSELTSAPEVNQLEVIFGFNTDSPELIGLPRGDSPRINRSEDHYMDPWVNLSLFSSTLKAFV